MEPAFYRGDILILDNTPTHMEVGEKRGRPVVLNYAAGVAIIRTHRAFVQLYQSVALLTIFLAALPEPPACLAAGDIVVFKIAGRDVPIVHRILRRHARGSLSGRDSSNSSALLPPSGRLGDGVEVDYLTKGDNNNIDDRNLYATGQLWLSRQEIVGKAVAFCPYVGMVTILLNDYPALKYALVGLMGLFVITGKET